MNLKDISEAIQGDILYTSKDLMKDYSYAFASDLMSDVLTVKQSNMLLITGLINVQAIRTAEMSDIRCIIFVRNKKVSEGMIALAQETGISLIHSSFTMFKTCGLLFTAGLKPVY
ncbi:MAG: hypothetical protein Q8867_09170 [Bacteroidota bacterium]|nr:hypothetical protein [Bacteroidota bacterium]